jgi:prevent-host-death family protein
MARITATDFKARCLELMDRVAERRVTYVITKRGKTIAKLVPADPPRTASIFGCMAGEMEIVGDLEKPLWTEAEWRGFERARVAQEKAWDREWTAHGTIAGKRTVGQPPTAAKRGGRVRRTRGNPKR